jgi:ABC-type sugar transport system ATPase subunit
MFDGNLNVQTTGTEGLSDEMKTYYSDYLIDHAKPNLVHDQFGQKHPIPKNGGKKIQFRKFTPFSKATTVLKEGITPDGGSLEVTVLESEVKQYGYYVTLSDILQLTAIDNVSLVVGAQNREKVAQELLELLPQEALDVPVAELSGGQRRRVEVVRALLYPSSAVLLDEAFSSLDDESHAIAASFVRNRLAGRTLLAASHDANDAVLLGAKQLRLFE